MDLRKKKTLQAIEAAFCHLRNQKPLEQISVTELVQQAQISKATFYLHYRDIFDLSEKLQVSAIKQVLDRMDISISLIDHWPEFTQKIMTIVDQDSLQLSVLFSGSQMVMFPILLENQLREYILAQHPELKEDTELSIRLTYHIQGSYHTYLRHAHHTDMRRILEIIDEIHSSAGMILPGPDNSPA